MMASTSCPQANTNWHEITILRTYVRYLKQIRYPFSRAYVERALNNNPKIARLIVDMFKGFHDPETGDESKAAGCAIAIDHELQSVDSLDEDRIMRIMTAWSKPPCAPTTSSAKRR